MGAIRSLFILIWNWISTNRDALILEAVSIALTVGLIEAFLRWREGRKWSPMRKQVALSVGWTLERAFMEIMEISRLTWSDVVPREMMMVQADEPTKHFQTIQARFFEQQYERDFESKYHNRLRQASRDELAALSEGMGYALTDLDRGIDLASRLFGPEVMTALSELREQVRWTRTLIYYQVEADPDERDFRFIQALASKMARALILVWENVD